MDWNWFFSSLSQSAAAIVGIFGAFIITKILSNQTAFSEKNSHLRELIANAQKVSDDAGGLYFEWYNKHTTTRELEKASDIVEEGSGENAEIIYNKLNFSPFIEKGVVTQAIDQLIHERKIRIEREQEEARQRIEVEERLKKLRETGRASALLGSLAQLGLGSSSGLATSFKNTVLPRLSGPSISGELTKERDSIENIIRNAKHHVRLISDFLDSINGNPESSPQIAYSLALITILFFIGVIYPLSFMPLPLNATIELSLSAFFLCFSLSRASC